MFTEEDYVSLETAKLLKKKGFDEKTHKRYVEKIEGSEREVWDDEEIMYTTVWDVNIYPKPTLYEAQKWLLEKHNLFVEITAVALRGSNSPCGFSTNIFYGDESDWELCDCLNDVSSYQQALDAGIQEALKLI